MPESSMSVYFTVIDGGSTVLARIGDKTKALDKETQQLNQTYKDMQKANESLTKKQFELEKQLASANKECKDAKKAFKDLGDEASSSAYDEARKKQAALKEELKRTTDAIKDNEKAFKSNQEAIRKGAVGGSYGNTGSILDSAASRGMKQLFGSAISQLAAFGLESALGQPSASFVGSTLSGAATGFALTGGNPFGALVGGVAGSISGGAQVLTARDDAFKDYYKGLYEAGRDATAEGIAAGSTIAAGRERDKITFTTLFKDADKAEEFLSGLVDKANTTPFLYDDLTAMSKTLASYGFKDQLGPGEEGFEILDTLQKIGDAGAALGMSTGDMNEVSAALGRMYSSNKTTLELLEILNNRKIGAVGMLAEAKGMNVADTYSAISKGEIAGADAVKIILDALDDKYFGSMEEQSKTFAGLASTLEGMRQEIQNAGGEGYNTLRNAGMQEEIASYGGALGEALKEISAISGENKAYLENLSGQYMREAQSAVLLGEKTTLFRPEDQETLEQMGAEYAKLKEEREAGSEEAGLQMEALWETAQAMATAAYESSDQYMLMQEVERDQIAAIRENTKALDGWSNKMLLLQEMGKGLLAGNNEKTKEFAEQQYGSGIYDQSGLAKSYGSSNAYGHRAIPYDNFPALLHQGERVLTASEARAMDAGTAGGGVQVSIGSVTIGGGLSTWDIAVQIAQELERAAVAAAPR